MARFCGKIGFVHTVETSPGVHEEVSTERTYRGDILYQASGWSGNDQVNENITLSNRFSIVADSYMAENIGNMRYVVHMGVKWKISNVEDRRPRLILSLGAQYASG